MIKYNEKEYYSPKEAAKIFNIPLPTIYYWVNEQDTDTLDLDELCEDLPIDRMELRSKIYIKKEILERKTEELKRG